MKLIGQNCAVQFTLGNPQGSSTAFPTGTPTVITSLCREVSIEESAIDVDVSGLGDGLELSAVKRSRAELSIKMLVDAAAGPLFYGKIGYNIKVDVKAKSSFATAQSFVGYISKRPHTLPDGEQIEEITVKIGTDGYTYTSLYS